MATALTEINSPGDNNTLAKVRHAGEPGRLQTAPPTVISLRPLPPLKSCVWAWEPEVGPSPHPSPRQAAGGRWEGGQEGLAKSGQWTNLWEYTGKGLLPTALGRESSRKERCALVGSRSL